MNENDPLEPVHIHAAQGKPTKNATKIWITRAGGCLLQNNQSGIPERKLRIIMQIVAARHEEIVRKWIDTFGEIRYYC